MPIVLNSSCESCRASKVKCSGEKPCQRCSCKGYSCVYQPRKKRGKAREDRSVVSDSDMCSGIGSLPCSSGQLPKNEVVEFCLQEGFPIKFINNLIRSGVSTFSLVAEIKEEELFERFGKLSYEQLLKWRTQISKVMLQTLSTQNCVLPNTPLCKVDPVTNMCVPLASNDTMNQTACTSKGPDTKSAESQCAQFLSSLGNMKFGSTSLSQLCSFQCPTTTSSSNCSIRDAASAYAPGLFNLFNTTSYDVTKQYENLLKCQNQLQNNGCSSSQLYLPDIKASQESGPGDDTDVDSSVGREYQSAKEEDDDCSLNMNTFAPFCDKFKRKRKCVGPATECKIMKQFAKPSNDLATNKRMSQVCKIKERMALVDWLITLLERLTKISCIPKQPPYGESCCCKEQEFQELVPELKTVLANIVKKLQVVDDPDIPKHESLAAVEDSNKVVGQLKTKTLSLVQAQFEALRQDLSKVKDE